MPGKDCTGPSGEGPAGRRIGPCNDPISTEEAERTERVDASVSESQEKRDDAYGVGRDGKPHESGRGHCGGRQHHGYERKKRWMLRGKLKPS
jgi:hypothetical protein